MSQASEHLELTQSDKVKTVRIGPHAHHLAHASEKFFFVIQHLTEDRVRMRIEKTTEKHYAEHAHMLYSEDVAKADVTKKGDEVIIKGVHIHFDDALKATSFKTKFDQTLTKVMASNQPKPARRRRLVHDATSSAGSGWKVFLAIMVSFAMMVLAFNILLK